ncbi:MAG TPA: acyl-CoA dehydrogenase family protein [Pseudonocardiaceae bacterium]|nr:acyl-CoA dehydrogenase family protein [Pseudonocardiaceae bacterium]
MTTVEMLDTDTEQQLRAAVRKLLSQRVEPRWLAAGYDGPTDRGPLWRALTGEIGVAGLLVAEQHGGAGAGMREAAVVAEEIGRTLAPVPFLASAVVATVALARAGDHDLLTRLASGESTAAVATSFAAVDVRPAVTVEPSGLTGAITTVAGVEMADVILVAAKAADGIELHAVTPGRGVTITTGPSLDMTRPISDVVLAAAPSRRIEVPDAIDALNRGLRAGAVALAGEQVGVARWCFDTTLQYVKQRVQFGRPIGSFQAIKHRLADLWVEINQAEAAARYAADVLGRDHSDSDIATAVAQSYCGTVAVHAAEECVQLHGGIGMTWEHPAHLYLNRAKADELAFGNPYQHRSRLAGLVDLPPR